MTTQEFSNMFDTLLNSYNSQSVFGEGAAKSEIVLDEYEKSVLLTQAQDIIVKTYFDNRLNPQGQGFDESSRRQIDFSSLITVADGQVYNEGTPYDSRGKLYKMPSGVLMVLNEKVITDQGTYVVVPINYREYDRQMSKAYTQPLKKQCWRLFQNNSDTDIIAELIPRDSQNITKYSIRYVKRPSPIVLTNLSGDNLSVDGVDTVSECTLNPIIHIDILNKAVELAISTRGNYSDFIKNQQQEAKR